MWYLKTELGKSNKSWASAFNLDYATQIEIACPAPKYTVIAYFPNGDTYETLATLESGEDAELFVFMLMKCIKMDESATSEAAILEMCEKHKELLEGQKK